MKHLALIGLLGASLSAASVAATVNTAAPVNTASNVNRVSRPNAARCGGSLWQMKTLSDPQRKNVSLTPRTTTIGALASLQAPSRMPTGRSTSFQRQTWELPASTTIYRKETGGIRLVLFDHQVYMNAVIPSPSCLPKSARNRQAMLDTWRLFLRCTHPTTEWQPLGAVGFVRGIGFWSGQRYGRGQAANGAELHPVTGFRPVVGC